MIITDPYYNRKEVSNSDLTALKNYFMCKDDVLDLAEAFRFGNLVDAMLTEPNKVDHLKLQVEGVQFYSWEWNLAKEMIKAFRADPYCMTLLKMSTGQKNIIKNDFRIEHNNFEFFLNARCKYDIFVDAANFGGDIKTTTATTHEQFVAACLRFDYDRSRAWYMDLSGADKDVIIGISKKNCKIFKIPIDRNHSFYIEGKKKYQELAFKHTYMFGDIDRLKEINPSEDLKILHNTIKNNHSFDSKTEIF